MEFKDKVIVITGSANGIGKYMSDEFKKLGANVCDFDRNPNDFYVGDLSKKEDIETFVSKVLEQYKTVDIIINNAAPLNKGIDEASYEDFEMAMKVGATATFYLVKLLKEHLAEGASIINISSTRSFMSQSQTETYSAAKGATVSLTHALANSLKHKARVNCISPGWIDTKEEEHSKEDKYQHLTGRVGKSKDIFEMVKFLASEKSSFITGQDFVVDGGMTKQMIYHNDEGWKLEI